MLPTAPNAALTSPCNHWDVYYKYAMNAAMKGEEIKTDWAEGYETGAVGITELGASCAAGTAENGTLKVFDTSTFTVNGAKLESYPVDLSFIDFSTMTTIYQGETVEPVVNGEFEESTFRSAPYFTVRIDDIIEK